MLIYLLVPSPAVIRGAIIKHQLGADAEQIKTNTRQSQGNSSEEDRKDGSSQGVQDTTRTKTTDQLGRAHRGSQKLNHELHMDLS